MEGNMKNKIQLYAIVSFFGALFVLVSCGQKTTQWQGKIEEVEGVTVINSPRDPLYGEDSFMLEDDLAIGNEEMEEEYMFQNILDLVVDDEENIYVTDSKAAHILVFDQAGNRLRTIGKRGQGPGEFMYPVEIKILSQQELMINDRAQARIHYFDLDGKYLRQFSSSSMTAFIRPKINPMGHLIVGYVIPGDEFKTALIKVDSELKPILEITSLPIESRPNSQKYHYFELRRTTNMVWDVMKNGDIIWGDFANCEIRVHSPEGDLKKKICWDSEPYEITKTEKERLIKEYFGDNGAPSQISIEFPKHFPPFIRFTCDEDGRIFAQTYKKTEDGERDYFEVFDSEGKYIAKIALKSRPIMWKNSKLYSIEEDEDGFQIVKRYHVTWKI
jgi:hypothetical protein